MGKLKKKFVAGLTFISLFAGLTACGTTTNQPSTTQPGTSGNPGTTTSEVVETEAAKFAKKVDGTVTAMQAGNLTFYDTKETSTTLLNGNGEAEVRKDGKTEYYYVEGANTYNIFRNSNGQWERRDTDDFKIPDWSGYKVEELTATTAKLVKGQTELVASYRDDRLIVDVAADQSLEIYNIGKTNLTIPQYIIPQTKDEKIAAFAAELNKLKTPNFTINENVDNQNHTYLVANNGVKADNDYYTTENGTNYRYYFDSTANTWYREEGSLSKNFNYTSVQVEDLNERTNEYAVKLNDTAYTAYKDGDAISLYNTTGSWVYSDLGATNVNVPTNWQEKAPVENNLIVENGVYNVKLMKQVLADWIAGNNQFGRDIITAKASLYGALQGVALVNPDLEVYALTTNDDAGTKSFIKLKITDDTLLNDMATQNITTQDEFVERLNALTARKISIERLIDIDRTSSQSDVNARAENLLAKVGSDAHVVFAYETGSKGSSLAFGRPDFWYTTVIYDSNSKMSMVDTSTMSLDDVTNDTENYGVVGYTMTDIYDQNLTLYAQADLGLER